MIVSAQWLLPQLSNPQIVVIDCRFQLSNPAWGYQQYLKSHIPGAYYLDLNQDLSAPVQKHGGRHPLVKPELLAAKLAQMGVFKDETTIVVYDDSRFAFAARLWWLLRYLGHNRVALLDGGWRSWQQQNYPVDAELPLTKPGEFVPTRDPSLVVDIEAVKACQDLSTTVLIDSRSGDRFLGKIEPIDPVAGHIPGAINSPWQGTTDEEGFLLPLKAQKKLWADYRAAEEIIVYCGSGVTACVNLFSLQLVGVENAKLYPGGWSDWCSYLIS